MEKKKETTIVFIVAFFIAIASIVGGIILSPKETIKTPIVGDVWEHSRTGDPFDKKNVVTWKVIDVKSNYVKYVESNQDTLSMSVKAFMHDSERISRK